MIGIGKTLVSISM